MRRHEHARQLADTRVAVGRIGGVELVGIWNEAQTIDWIEIVQELELEVAWNTLKSVREDDSGKEWCRGRLEYVP